MSAPSAEATNTVVPYPAVTGDAPVPTETTSAPPAEPAAAPTTAAITPAAAAASGAAAPAPGAAPAPAASVVAPTATAAPTEKPAAPEPESKLTSKFTEAEWAALKTFREDLPKTLAATFPDDPKASSRLVDLWGVPVDPSAPNKDARVSAVLMKFLRARYVIPFVGYMLLLWLIIFSFSLHRSLNPVAASEMLLHTLRWRDEFNIASLMDEKFDDGIYGGAAHAFGKDKQGHPVTYNLYGGDIDLKQLFSDVNQFIRWRVQFMEKSCRELDFTTVDQMVQVHGQQSSQ
jgi:phosphatidylinositol transfer protein SFH5